MRIDAYNAITKMYQTNNVSGTKRIDGVTSLSDKLEFSQTAKSYQTAKAAVYDAPDVRQDKVAEIKARISAGNYNISSEAIADKILSNLNTIAF